MEERKHRERRQSRDKPAYPFTDSNGELVTSNRRRVVERRGTGDETDNEVQTTGMRLTLRFQDVEKELWGPSAQVILGRKFLCDVSVASPFASRQHAYIRCRGDKFLLVDDSTNGTFLRQGDGSHVRLTKDQATLIGDGAISLGRPVRDGDEYLIYFSIGPKFNSNSKLRQK